MRYSFPNPHVYGYVSISDSPTTGLYGRGGDASTDFGNYRNGCRVIAPTPVACGGGYLEWLGLREHDIGALSRE